MIWCIFHIWNEYLVGTKIGGRIGLLVWALRSKLSR
jgi:hypothetical protein